MFGLGPQELLVIAVIVVLLFSLILLVVRVLGGLGN